MKFCSLFSSSKGNSTYISDNKTSVLVDVGVSAKRMNEALLARDIDPKSIDAVFLTHDHTDHIAGVRVFCKKWNIPVFATRGTINRLQERDDMSGVTLNEIQRNGKTELGSILVNHFESPHDAAESCLFSFEFENGQRCAVCTDLGQMTDTVYDGIKGSDIVLLESNHDVGMLENGPYPFSLIKRIEGNFGHLSNDDCATCAKRLIADGTTRFVLAHLSEENNLPFLAREVSEGELSSIGAKKNVDFLLDVAKPIGDGKIVRF